MKVKTVQLTNSEILLISRSVEFYVRSRIKCGVDSLQALNKLSDMGRNATVLLEKLAEVPVE